MQQVLRVGNNSIFVTFGRAQAIAMTACDSPMLKTFSEEIVRHVELNRLHWPDVGAASEYPGAGYCRNYDDLRGSSWQDVAEANEFETRILALHAASPEPISPEDDYLEEIALTLEGLDVGVASAVLALSAVGCITFFSCNGGATGESHSHTYPFIDFFARPEAVPVLLVCAEEAGVGMRNQDGGAIQLNANDVRSMLNFAGILKREKRRFVQARKEERKVPQK